MTRSVATAGVLALVLAFSVATVATAQDGVPADAVENPNTGEVSDMLVPQADAYETYAEHIRVLNDCDWLGLMAQYPDNAEIHLAGGAVIAGRQAIGDLFAGFVLPFPQGNCGLFFTEQSRLEVTGTENVLWSADADFLAEPHLGSDAYATDGQYMVAMVTTFGQPGGLVYTEEAQAQLDALAAEAAAAAEDTVDDAEKQAEDKADDAEEKADAKEDELEDKADAKEEELRDDG